VLGKFFNAKTKFFLIFFFKTTILDVMNTKKTKDKMSRHVAFNVPQLLFDKFEKVCDERYQTTSAVLRDLMVEYVKEKNKEDKS